MSGGTPSTPDKLHRGVIREPANARQHDTDSLRIHRRLQAKKAKRCNSGVASHDLAQARFSTQLHDSTLQRPSVSIATTTHLHLCPIHQLRVLPFSVPATCIGNRPVHHSSVWASSLPLAVFFFWSMGTETLQQLSDTWPYGQEQQIRERPKEASEQTHQRTVRVGQRIKQEHERVDREPQSSLEQTRKPRQEPAKSTRSRLPRAEQTRKKLLDVTSLPTAPRVREAKPEARTSTSRSSVGRDGHLHLSHKLCSETLPPALTMG